LNRTLRADVLPDLVKSGSERAIVRTDDRGARGKEGSERREEGEKVSGRSWMGWMDEWMVVGWLSGARDQPTSAHDEDLGPTGVVGDGGDDELGHDEMQVKGEARRWERES
jgi:hypothetical protein